MEKKKVIISYACPVQWNTMKSIDDRNKFCGSCKMKVKDFTKETELNTEGTHCGRFRMDQVESINRSFNFNPKQVFVVSLLSLLGMAAPLAAQSVSDSTSSETKVVKQQIISLTGNVRDSISNEGIPFANIVLKGKDGGIIAGGASNIDGSFSITIPKELLERDGVTVQVSVIGYASKTLNAPKANSGVVKLNISLSESYSEITTGIIIMGGHNTFDRHGTTSFDSEDIRESPYRQ